MAPIMVVIATGSHWSENGLAAETHAPIPGADAALAHCLTPEQVMAGKPVGERVVIVDGDNHFTGAAMAELLADQGKQVTIVTDAATVAEYTYFTMEMGNLKRMDAREEDREVHVPLAGTDRARRGHSVRPLPRQSRLDRSWQRAFRTP